MKFLDTQIDWLVFQYYLNHLEEKRKMLFVSDMNMSYFI